MLKHKGKLYFTFFLLLFILSACGKEKSNSIRFALNTSVVTLDPRHTTDAVSDRIGRLIYDRLTGFDAQFNIKPDLANWQAINEKHYRFTLKDENKTFHNGNALTSHDVKATFDSILNSKNISPHRGSIEHINNIQIIDHKTLDFFLRKTDPLFPGRLNIGILPKDLIDSGHPFNTSPVGSGPFRLLNWNNENQLRLHRIHDGQIIEFVTVKDPNMRSLKLARGEVDLIQNNLPPESIQWLHKQKGISIKKGKGNTFSYIGFNLKDDIVGQKQIRKAIAHAIDREAILKYVLADAARIAESLLPRDHWAGHQELSGYSHDPELARNLLKEIAYENKPINISYKTSNNPFRVRLATIIQHQLKQAGFNISIQSYDWGTFYGDIKSGRFQMYSLSWVGLNLPDIFRYVLHSESIPPKGANRGRYNNKQVDELIEKAESISELNKQVGYYQKLQEIIHEELPFIPLWYENNIVAIRSDIIGYKLTPDGHYDSLISVKRLQH